MDIVKKIEVRSGGVDALLGRRRRWLEASRGTAPRGAALTPGVLPLPRLQATPTGPMDKPQQAVIIKDAGEV